VRSQLPWVIISPSTAAAHVSSYVRQLPGVVAACVTVGLCVESALAVAPLSSDVLVLLDDAPVTFCSPNVKFCRESDDVLPTYFTFTSGSSASPRCVKCSGSSLWARLLVQLSPSAPLRGLVPDHLRRLHRPAVDWREFLQLSAEASERGALGGSVCIWKTATGFCDTIVEMLQGITYGVSQVIFCSDGALSVRCSCVALALCQREHSFQHSPDLPITRFDVRRLFRPAPSSSVSHYSCSFADCVAAHS
jgi:hypothetical protein